MLAVCTVGDAKPPAEEMFADADKSSASPGESKPSEKPLLSITANGSLNANEHIDIASLEPREVIAVAVCVPWASTTVGWVRWEAANSSPQLSAQCSDSLPALPLLQEMRYELSCEFMFVMSIVYLLIARN